MDKGDEEQNRERSRWPQHDGRLGMRCLQGEADSYSGINGSVSVGVNVLLLQSECRLCAYALEVRIKEDGGAAGEAENGKKEGAWRADGKKMFVARHGATSTSFVGSNGEGANLWRASRQA